MASILNKTSTDEFTELVARGAAVAQVTVTGAAVICSIGLGSPPLWGDDEFLIPGVHTYRQPLDAIRFRSAVAGTPAQVSITTTHARRAARA